MEKVHSAMLVPLFKHRHSVSEVPNPTPCILLKVGKLVHVHHSAVPSGQIISSHGIV